jgi:hypothetical protein
MGDMSDTPLFSHRASHRTKMVLLALTVIAAALIIGL